MPALKADSTVWVLVDFKGLTVWLQLIWWFCKTGRESQVLSRGSLVGCGGSYFFSSFAVVLS